MPSIRHERRMVNVHHIYIGRSWSVSGLADDLVRLLDRAPGLLYAACTSWTSGSETGLTDVTDCEGAIRIGMAQCHVAVLWGGIDDPAADWSLREARAARTLFRRSIPLLAVVPRACERSAERTHLADRIVGWSAVDLARGIVALTATAAENRHLGREAAPLPKVSSATSPDLPSIAADARGEPRPLPIAEIVAAYRSLRTDREHEPAAGASM